MVAIRAGWGNLGPPSSASCRACRNASATPAAASPCGRARYWWCARGAAVTRGGERLTRGFVVLWLQAAFRLHTVRALDRAREPATGLRAGTAAQRSQSVRKSPRRSAQLTSDESWSQVAGRAILWGRPSSVKGARCARVATRPPSAALDPGASAAPNGQVVRAGASPCPLDARPATCVSFVIAESGGCLTEPSLIVRPPRRRGRRGRPPSLGDARGTGGRRCPSSRRSTCGRGVPG
jgi:hypothetical protein